MFSFLRKRTVFSAQERISFPEFGMQNVVAKIDTGAYTGALHCETIELVKNHSGKQVLQFRPLDKHHDLHTTSEFKYVKVKSASGHKERRFIVYTTMIIKGKKYRGYIGLTNRADLRRQVLIGRRFLRKHGILVDVGLNKRIDDKSEVI
jgi:hypothetical protein